MMPPPDHAGTPLNAMMAAERARFTADNPRSRVLAAESAAHWLHGVPLHWMVDWGTPFPLFIERAHGVTLTDADGRQRLDFCLGDTGAMFGHAPPPLAEALIRAASAGLTTMLPSPDAPAVGRLLAERFGLPHWQVTATASDANRAVLRWARGVTGRPKILVLHGCYHGAVEDTFVALDAEGRVHNRQGLVGEVRDVSAATVMVEFNDIPALERALAAGDVAAVLAEPVMTNCSMVLPEPGYHDALRRLTRATGTLLVIDETHTISSGPSGYTGTHGLEPDFFVLGKPIAGGVPAAVYGWSSAVDARIRTLLAAKPPGYSGIGTTLAGSALQLALMRAMLTEVMTEAAYAKAMPLAARLEQGLAAAITAAGLPWHAVRVGLRVEIVPTLTRPRNGGEALAIAHDPAMEALHLHALNRGVVITPFHGMLLVSPMTAAADIERAVAVLADGMRAVGESTIGPT
jgi:glutamate-1-semialdehyde 2,1-aminomutase